MMLARLAAASVQCPVPRFEVQTHPVRSVERVRRLAGSAKWATEGARPVPRRPQLAFVEFKNEVDPGNATEMGWVRTELPMVRAPHRFRSRDCIGYR